MHCFNLPTILAAGALAFASSAAIAGNFPSMDNAWGEVWGVEFAAERIAQGHIATALIADHAWGEVWGMEFAADRLAKGDVATASIA